MSSALFISSAAPQKSSMLQLEGEKWAKTSWTEFPLRVIKCAILNITQDIRLVFCSFEKKSAQLFFNWVSLHSWPLLCWGIFVSFISKALILFLPFELPEIRAEQRRKRSFTISLVWVNGQMVSNCCRFSHTIIARLLVCDTFCHQTPIQSHCSTELARRIFGAVSKKINSTLWFWNDLNKVWIIRQKEPHS